MRRWFRALVRGIMIKKRREKLKREQIKRLFLKKRRRKSQMSMLTTS